MKKKNFVRPTIHCRMKVIVLCIGLATAILFFTGTPAFAKVYLNVGLLGEPKNLNPFQATDAWTKKVIRLLYQPLYITDPDTLTLIPWLAEDQPVYDPQTKTVTFHLRQMKWDDGTEFSADDVVFTAELLKNFRVPRYYAYWEFVKKIEAVDKRTVKMTLENPMAILNPRTLTSWIVQKKKWAPIAKEADKRLKRLLGSKNAKSKDKDEAFEYALEEALKTIRNHEITKPTGLGPFKFKEWKKGKYVHLLKNDLFFGQGMPIAGRKLGPYIDGVKFKVYDTINAATLALRQGSIDFLWKGVSQAMVEDLGQDPDINVLMSLDSGYRYLGFNLRSAPMSDPAFRRAIAYLIDKDFIVERILHQHGQRLDSVVLPGNVFYFNPNTPAYGKGMDRDRRAHKAYSILTASGYRWKRSPLDASGEIQKGQGLIMPDGKAMPPLTILTPPAHYDTEMAAVGQVIQAWLNDFGIDVSWRTMAFGGLFRKIRNERDFDMFIMAWRSLSVDPDYLRRFFHSSYNSPDQWNDTGYNNAEFDRLADLQAKALNMEDRRRIVMALQSRLMTDLPYVPLFVPHRMEGIRSDRFEGWTKRVGGVGNIWTFCLLKPTRR